ncbi:DUF55-domain-containing protein [Gloeopeniophorella convolvens]|nr:DUF55-domain-containing protein [Gloeopeniophorella convolvens]
MATSAARHWLMKAEPNSRIEKGKDVKFSVDDFEVVGTTPWEGVRNAEARNLMKSMKVGDKVLFYHSNCVSPGIAGFAEVAKEAYPDYTAWDPKHPYYDPKSDETNPKWYMVDVKFASRAKHFVPYPLLRDIAAGGEEPSANVEYVGEEGVKAIKGMDLVHRGRLSVQRVELAAWDVIVQMAEKGGWDEDVARGKKSKGRATAPGKTAGRKRKGRDEEEDEAGAKRSSGDAGEPRRRSTRRSVRKD